jgi:hypothetical protein
METEKDDCTIHRPALVEERRAGNGRRAGDVNLLALIERLERVHGKIQRDLALLEEGLARLGGKP